MRVALVVLLFVLVGSLTVRKASALTPLGSLDARPTDLGSLCAIDLGELQAVPVGGEGTRLLDLDTCRRIDVVLYTQAGCGPCEVAKRDLAALPWINVIERSGDDVPEWVTSFPTVHYATEDGLGRQLRGWTPEVRERLIHALRTDCPTAAAEIEIEFEASGGYPVRGGWWSVSGDWSPSRDELLAHLTIGARHAGKFDREYLASLTYAELHSLHSDDHENRIDRQAVRLPAANQVRRPATSRAARVYSSCPTCPRR